MKLISCKLCGYTLTNGTLVLGKVVDGKVWPRQYANRTQAETSALKVGGSVFQAFGRPFYVRLSDIAA